MPSTGAKSANDMSGKTVVITGANSGIGLATAIALAKQNAEVVITARDAGRGAAAIDTIKTQSGKSAELVVFDLGDMSSVRKGAAEILERTERIDVLVNNAGIVLTERQETAVGLEKTFAVNHLGPFLLTQLLTERLTESAPSRIVNVSSAAHKGAKRGLDFDDLQSKKSYAGMKVYSLSKLANLYFTAELSERLSGKGVIANSLHPGTVRTGYGRDGDAKGFLGFGIALAAPFFASPAKGALTSIYLASSPEVAGVTGKYFVKCREKEVSAQAQDRQAARRLWAESEALAPL